VEALALKQARWDWVPAGILVLGFLAVTAGVKQQRVMELRAPLDEAIPARMAGAQATEVEIAEAERQVAGMTSYVMRSYAPAGAAAAGAAAAAAPFTLYVGYYDSQVQGKSIHSPKNCMPGAGWEPLTSVRQTIATPAGEVAVNRYILQKGNERALVLYWYQGRGRIAANEYLVKWNLLRDQALRRRSDEALVRIFIPVVGSEDETFNRAAEIARTVIPAVNRALPV